jgi:hypothetical protein
VVAPARCSVCKHERRSEIESAMVAGRPLRVIGKEFSIGKNAIDRHQKRHLAQSIANASQAPEVVRGDVLLAQLQGQRARADQLYREAERILRRAQARRDHGTSLAAIRAAASTLAEIRSSLELLAKLAGQLRESPTINILVSSEWGRVRAAVIVALAPFPDARAAVSQALLALPIEAGSDHAGA